MDHFNSFIAISVLLSSISLTCSRPFETTIGSPPVGPRYIGDSNKVEQSDLLRDKDVDMKPSKLDENYFQLEVNSSVGNESNSGQLIGENSTYSGDYDSNISSQVTEYTHSARTTRSLNPDVCEAARDAKLKACALFRNFYKVHNIDEGTPQPTRLWAEQEPSSLGNPNSQFCMELSSSEGLINRLGLGHLDLSKFEKKHDEGNRTRCHRARFYTEMMQTLVSNRLCECCDNCHCKCRTIDPIKREDCEKDNVSPAVIAANHLFNKFFNVKSAAENCTAAPLPDALKPELCRVDTVNRLETSLQIIYSFWTFAHNLLTHNCQE